MLMVTPISTLKELADQSAEDSGLSPKPLFPWWCALIVQGGREARSAEWFLRRDIAVYLPQFSKKIKRRGATNARRLCSMMPGLLFMPLDELKTINRRDEVFEYAHIYGFMPGTAGQMALLSKAQIEVIRMIEGKLNLPMEAKGVMFKIGQKVGFLTELYSAYLGDATIFEIAGPGRIGVEVQKLFGRTCKIYVSDSEIEAI